MQYRVQSIPYYKKKTVSVVCRFGGFCFLCYHPELPVGLVSLTQPNPTHQLTDPIQPITKEKFGSTTQPNPTHDL